jgi:hypothetical protein
MGRHDLSKLAHTGLDITVAEIMGHTSSGITERIYTESLGGSIPSPPIEASGGRVPLGLAVSSDRAFPRLKALVSSRNWHGGEAFPARNRLDSP